MTDAEIAAVAGLAGVGLSGGFQFGLAVRADRRERRAAARLVEAELSGLRSRVLFMAASTEWGALVRLGEPPVWKEHEALLARHLSRRQWLRVTTAYGLYNTLCSMASSLEKLKEAAPEAQLPGYERLDRVATGTAEVLEKAHRQLVPVLGRLGLRRTRRDIDAMFLAAGVGVEQRRERRFWPFG
jgi:hypothetical protein